jgi:hypothetical protein
MAPLRDYDVADLIDEPDKVRVLNDPTNAYSQAFAMAALRNYDDIIIAALGGVAATGETGSDPVSATATISSTTVFNNGRINSVDDLLEIKKDFDEAEVPSGDRYIVMHAVGYQHLLSIAEATSADYVTVKALVQGEIDTYLGFRFLRSERLLTGTVAPTSGNATFKCHAFHKSGLKLAVGMDTRGRITEMPNKRYSTQVFYSHTAGAVRMEEEKVVTFDIQQVNLAP